MTIDRTVSATLRRSASKPILRPVAETEPHWQDASHKTKVKASIGLESLDSLASPRHGKRPAASSSCHCDSCSSERIPILPLQDDFLSPSKEQIDHVLEAITISTKPFIRGSGGTRLYKVDEHLIVKVGRRVTLREGIAMEVIRQNTSIPVPRVHALFKEDEKYHILMDFIDGPTLQEYIQSDDGTSETVGATARRLAHYISHLRRLDMPSKKYGAWPEGPHACIATDFRATRAFSFPEEFHYFWKKQLIPYTHLEKIPETLSDHEWNDHPVLSHGDLDPKNIIIRDGQIASIVDWGCLGWYPKFWEYFMSTRGRSAMWAAEAKAAFGSDDDERRRRDYQLVMFDIIFRQDMY